MMGFASLYPSYKIAQKQKALPVEAPFARVMICS